MNTSRRWVEDWNANAGRTDSRRLSRRDLLRTSAWGLSGLLLAACSPVVGPPPVAGGEPAAAPASAMPAAPPRRPIVDTHIHLWKLPRTEAPMSDDATFPSGCCGEIPWLEVDALMSDYTATVGGQKVDQIVLIEASVATPPEKMILSNRWMLDTAAADEKILSVVGKLDPTQDTAAFAAQVDDLAADKNWVGIRIGGDIFLPDVEQAFANIKPNVLDNFAALASRGLMIDSLGVTGAVMGAIAEAVPGLTIVMDHVAEKPQTLEVEDGWRADMQAAGAAPGVHIKVSDIHRLSTTEMKGEWPVQFTPVTDPSSYVSVLDTLWDIFGAERLIFGTNWPVSNVAGLDVDSIDVQIGILESYLSGKGEANRDKVMHDNAIRVYSPRI